MFFGKQQCGPFCVGRPALLSGIRHGCKNEDGFSPTTVSVAARSGERFLLEVAVIGMMRHGYVFASETKLRHGARQKQGYRAGKARPFSPACDGLSFSSLSQGFAGHAGYRPPQVRDRDVRSWLFLASA